MLCVHVFDFDARKLTASPCCSEDCVWRQGMEVDADAGLVADDHDRSIARLASQQPELLDIDGLRCRLDDKFGAEAERFVFEAGGWRVAVWQCGSAALWLRSADLGVRPEIAM